MPKIKNNFGIYKTILLRTKNISWCKIVYSTLNLLLVDISLSALNNPHDTPSFYVFPSLEL